MYLQITFNLYLHYYHKIFVSFYNIFLNACVYFRPGGELNSGEDQVEGLKRLLTEVIVVKVEKKTHNNEDSLTLYYIND